MRLFWGEEIQKSKSGVGKDLEEFELHLPVGLTFMTSIKMKKCHNMSPILETEKEKVGDGSQYYRLEKVHNM